MNAVVRKRQSETAVKHNEKNKTLFPLIDVALEASALELAARKITPLVQLLKRNGVDIATSWSSKNYGFTWWLCACDLQFETIKKSYAKGALLWNCHR